MDIDPNALAAGLRGEIDISDLKNSNGGSGVQSIVDALRGTYNGLSQSGQAAADMVLHEVSGGAPGVPGAGSEVDISDVPTSHGGPLASGLVHALKSGATLPGDVATGKVDPMSDEGIARAQDMAGLAMTGGVAGAGEGAVVGAGPVRRASSLPMDEASRMGRAKELGYTIDAYKGSPSRVGGPVTDWKGRVLEDRPWEDLTHFDSPGNPHAGFFSSDPSVASRFADAFGHGYEGSNPAVFPVKLRMENPLVIDGKGKPAAAFQFDSIAREHGMQDELKRFKGAFEEGSPHDGVIVKGTKDEGDVYIPRDAADIRSRFAKFDPANEGKAMLLGSGGTDAASAAAPAAAMGNGSDIDYAHIDDLMRQLHSPQP